MKCERGGACTVSGSGCFSGSDAYENFQQLLQLYEAGVAATLVSPVWGQMQAYLSELTGTLTAKKDYISYCFCFERVQT